MSLNDIGAVVYVGLYRETEVYIDITKEDIEVGYIYIKCFECEGTGIWSYSPNDKEESCVSCKGTGEILINC